MLLFHGWICWKEFIMLAVIIIFWGYACSYAPLYGWLCQNGAIVIAVVLVSSTYQFACPPFYTRFLAYTARFPLIIRRFALASNTGVPTFLFSFVELTNARTLFFVPSQYVRFSFFTGLNSWITGGTRLNLYAIPAYDAICFQRTRPVFFPRTS